LHPLPLQKDDLVREGEPKLSTELVIGMLGWSTENIKEGKKGYCWFPTGPKDLRYQGGRVWKRIKVTAIEDIRAFSDLIVANEKKHVQEHTPVETKPLGYIYDDYKELDFTEEEIKYQIGKSAHTADKILPSSWVTELLYLKPDQDCYVRFNGKKRVQHKLEAGTEYEYKRRVRTLHVIRIAVDGTLTIRALGNLVGVI